MCSIFCYIMLHFQISKKLSRLLQQKIVQTIFEAIDNQKTADRRKRLDLAKEYSKNSTHQKGEDVRRNKFKYNRI